MSFCMFVLDFVIFIDYDMIEFFDKNKTALLN